MLDFGNYTFGIYTGFWILLSGIYARLWKLYFPGFILDFGNYTFGIYAGFWKLYFRDIYWILETILSGIYAGFWKLLSGIYAGLWKLYHPGYMLDFGNFTFGIYAGFWKLYFRDIYWILKLLAGIYAGFWILLSRIFADFFFGSLGSRKLQAIFFFVKFFPGRSLKSCIQLKNKYKIIRSKFYENY